MNNLYRRIERLEERLGAKAEPRVTVITNVAPWDGEETPCCVRIAPDRWAHAARGGPFTDEEIRELRENIKGKDKR